MGYVIGIAIFWVAMAIGVHEYKGYSWKVSFIVAPFALIVFLIAKVLGFFDD